MSNQQTDFWDSARDAIGECIKVFIEKTGDPDAWDVAGAFAAVGDEGLQRRVDLLNSALKAALRDPSKALDSFQNAARVAASGAAGVEAMSVPGNTAQRLIVGALNHLSGEFSQMAADIRAAVTQLGPAAPTWQNTLLGQAARVDLAGKALGGFGAIVGMSQVVSEALNGTLESVGEKSAGVLLGYGMGVFGMQAAGWLLVGLGVASASPVLLINPRGQSDNLFPTPFVAYLA